MSPQILTVVTSISGILGLMGLMAYLYYQLQTTKAERSVREIVEGEGLFNADQVLEILKQFSDDNTRLQALIALTQHDGTKARNILTKVNANVDIEKLTNISTQNHKNISRATATIFSVFAIIGLSYDYFKPLQSANIHQQLTDFSCSIYLRETSNNARALAANGTLNLDLDDPISFTIVRGFTSPQRIDGKWAGKSVDFSLEVPGYQKAEPSAKLTLVPNEILDLFVKKYEIVPVPDTDKAQRIIRAKDTSDLEEERCEIYTANQPGTDGYFIVDVAPNPNSHYSWARVKLKDAVSTNYYASVRIESLKGAKTLELVGHDVYFLVKSDFSEYLIWQSEDNQTPWKPLPVNMKEHPTMNTLGVYQQGRNVHVYINSKYLDSYVLSTTPMRGLIGLYIKTKPDGGSVHFQKLTVWELP